MKSCCNDGSVVKRKQLFDIASLLNPKQLYGGRSYIRELGARFYDPDIGRFISQDSYLGESGTPPSLHRYLYAYGNPTVWVDLFGYANTATWTGQFDERTDWVRPYSTKVYDTGNGLVDALYAAGDDVANLPSVAINAIAYGLSYHVVKIADATDQPIEKVEADLLNIAMTTGQFGPLVYQGLRGGRGIRSLVKGTAKITDELANIGGTVAKKLKGEFADTAGDMYEYVRKRLPSRTKLNVVEEEKSSLMQIANERRATASTSKNTPKWKQYEDKHGGQQTTMKTTFEGKEVTVRLDKPPTDSTIIDFKDYDWSKSAYNTPFIQEKVISDFQNQISKYQTIRPNIHMQFSNQPPPWVERAIKEVGGTYNVKP